MSDQASTPGGAGGAADSTPEAAAEDREAAMMREVMRRQERHREGGVDPDLDDADTDADPGASQARVVLGTAGRDTAPSRPAPGQPTCFA